VPWPPGRAGTRRVTAGDLAFELDAVSRAAGEDALLHDDASVYERARGILLARLRAVSTGTAPELG
jgi:hypothetical protein